MQNYRSVTLEGAQRFLADRGGAPASEVRQLSGGEFSRAYAYRRE